MIRKLAVNLFDQEVLLDHVVEIDQKRPLDLDRNIYRIFRPQHLIAMFETGENVLISPSKWDDPYENLLLRSEMKLPKGEKAKWAKRDIYAQCWMKTSDSDAMWRIYSHDTFAIRARTTARKLIESVIKSRSQEWAHLEAYIGGVDYKNTKDFERWATSFFAAPAAPTSRDLAETLLVKRWAFQHEKEVRVVLLPAHNNATESELHRYKVDPRLLVDHIMVDSRAPREVFEMYKMVFVDRLKFAGTFTRSKLYDAPSLGSIPFGHNGTPRRDMFGSKVGNIHRA